MAPIRSILLLIFAILLRCSGNSTISLSKRNSGLSSQFPCRSHDQRISFSRVCDGIVDCIDGHDENDSCSDEGSLLYYVYVEEAVHHGDITSDGEFEYCSGVTSGRRYINVNVIYLNEAERYSFLFLNDTIDTPQMVTRNGLSLDNIQLNWEGPQLDVYYLEHSVRRKLDISFYFTRPIGPLLNYTTSLDRIRVMRDDFTSDDPVPSGSHAEERIRFRVTSMKNIVYDWIASNIYAIFDGKINVCDKDFIICVDLPTKFADNPIFLAISYYERLLFWIEQENSERFHLYKYALNDTGKAKRIPIVQRIKNPMWLTVDYITNRLYWMHNDDHNDINNVTFGSVTFDGTGENIILPNGTTVSNKTSSFAVFKNFMYWPETEDGVYIWACRVESCYPHVYSSVQPFESKPTKSQKFKLGSLMINYKPISLDKIKNPCVNSSCSHLCVPETETTYQCYCEHETRQILEERESGYCENTTLLITYGNSLYILGLFDDTDRYPMVRQFSINISSISAVVYNPNEGNVFLTEKGTQRIYLWSPRRKDLQLLVDDGPGTIRLIEYDSRANNLYWIDPVNHVIKIMNMDSYENIVNLLQGNSTYSPFDLVLIPQRKHMIVLFSKNNKEITIEQMSMDGDPDSRIVLHTDYEADGPDNVFLRYVKPLQLMAMLDKQINKIRYLYISEDSTSAGQKDHRFVLDVENAIVDRDPGKIECMTTIGRSLIWVDENLTIHRVPFDGHPRVTLSIYGDQSIQLGLKKLNDTILNVVAVESFLDELQSECFNNNGHCEEFCILADNFQGYSCLCTKNGVLFNGTHCEHPTTTRMEEHTVPSTSTETEKTTSPKTETTSPLPDSASFKGNQTFNSTEKAIPEIQKSEWHVIDILIWEIILPITVIALALYIFRKKLRRYLNMISLRLRAENQLYLKDSTICTMETRTSDTNTYLADKMYSSYRTR